MIAVLFTALAVAASAEAAQPSAAEIVARNRAATSPGRVLEQGHELWSVRIGGLSGTLETRHAGPDNLSTLELGPFRTEHGSYHGRRWHQNENGETILDQPEPSQAERGVSESVTRVHAPVDAWLVTTTFASGHVTRSYYDAHTYVLLRVERTANGRTTHANYDDFRTDARGRTYAAHCFGSEDRPGTDFDDRLTSEDGDPVADADLAIPPDRRRLVEFPPGTLGAPLPARIERGRVYVRVVIAGRAMDFLLDSGSSTIAIDEGVARSIGLTGYGRTTETVAGSFPSHRVIVPEVDLGPLTMHDVVMHTAPLAENEGTRTRVVGLLGFDFLDAVGLKIDYGAGTVDAFAPGSLVAPPGSIPFPLRLNGQIPVTAVTVGEATGDDFIIDTGAQFDLVLFQRFLRAHPETAETVQTPSVGYGNGVGGAVPYRGLEVKRMTLGPLALGDIAGVEALPQSALGFDTKDGLVGSGVLGRFTVYFDYSASRLFLGPPGAPASPAGTGRARRPSGARPAVDGGLRS